MQIRDHYIEAFGKIRHRYGEGSCGYRVPLHVSLKGAIGYTRRYVVESDKEHYRYDRYKKGLRQALRHMRFDPANRKICHLDLGCGPGLFSWVVRDCMLSRYGKKDGEIDCIGYDHARSMACLSNLFRQHFPFQYNWCVHHDQQELKRALESRKLSCLNILVTFGHVLIQTKNDCWAMPQFAAIIKRLLPCHSCIMVAVDAFSNDRPTEFQDAYKKLCEALKNVGVSIEEEHLRPESNVYARLRLER